jgi:hypothetical protein
VALSASRPTRSDEPITTGDAPPLEGRVTRVIDRGWFSGPVVCNLNVGTTHTYLVSVDEQDLLVRDSSCTPRAVTHPHEFANARYRDIVSDLRKCCWVAEKGGRRKSGEIVRSRFDANARDTGHTVRVYLGQKGPNVSPNHSVPAISTRFGKIRVDRMQIKVW